jgi:Phage T7 capsid assembly protein.
MGDTDAQQALQVDVTPSGQDAAGDDGGANTFNVTPEYTPALKPEGNEEKQYAGKFKSVEDLEKSYLELQKKLGQDGAEENAPDTKVTTDVPEADKVAAIEHTDEAVQFATEKGIDVAALTTEFERTGQLSEDSYQMLEKANITRDMVNAYIEGNRALAQRQIDDVKESIGGAEQYQRIMTWAHGALTDAEKASYDRIMYTGDVDAIKMAANGLAARYTKVKGSDPQVRIGGGQPAPNAGGYASIPEMTAAMKDPRYSKDPAYRNEVIAKVSRTKF